MHGLWADEPGFVAVTAGRLLGVPAVVSLLGGELVGLRDIDYGGQLSRANRLLTAQALRRAARVTAGSQSLRALARAWVDPARLVTQPLGVDTTLFTPAPPSSSCAAPLASPSGFALLHVASLAPVKDQAVLLRALAVVASETPEVHLHIVGDGPLRAALAAQAEALGLAAHVTFHGAIAHERLPDFYRAADLFVLSSRYESQSMVALEAGACGCPVVGTAVGLLPELLAQPAGADDRALAGENIVPIGDPAALAQAIVRLVRQPTERIEAGRTLQHRVAADYSLTNSTQRLLTLYAALL
jgi:glycosyltransferase involved in cell wall biosynthesis